MTTQYTPNLGQQPAADARRDATHIAVAPVVAGRKLEPGQHVGLLEDGTASAGCWPFIGVVDPFLKQSVEPGQSFWLFLYPGSVTSLRHVWSHPAFKAKVPEVRP